MTKRPTALLACTLVATILVLSGCGRKGALEASPDQNPAYPRPYPAIEKHGEPDRTQPPKYGTSSSSQSANQPGTAYSNYPRPKQSTYPASK